MINVVGFGLVPKIFEMPTHYHGTIRERLALDVFIKLNRATNSVGDRALAGLQKNRLTVGQFGTLECLYHLGPQKISDLARKHLQSKNNFTVIVDNLERSGLVRRANAEADRRVRLVELTDAGRALIEDVLPAHVAAIVDSMRALSEEELCKLNELLRKLGRGSTCASQDSV